MSEDRGRPRNQPRWDFRADGSVWISHTTVRPTDLNRLADVRELTLCNVRLPDGFLARLAHLEWLDLRGGSGTDLSRLTGCTGLRGLVVNQVRGMVDVSAISDLAAVEILFLYGLARLEALPPFKQLVDLRRLELGQLRSSDP